MSKPMHIGIAGAGIGGLAAASLLAADGHQVTVFDQFDAPRPVGSGLVIQPVGQAVLAEVGALDAARAMGNPISRMLGHEERSGRRVLDVWYDRRAGGRYGLAIHRAALFQSLLDAAQSAGATIYAGKEVCRADGRNLYFADGSHDGPFDLIIDSAGATSPLSPMRARPLPYGAVWGTVDWPETELPWGELRQRYRKAARMAGVLPIGQLPGQSGRKAAIFWSLPVSAHEDWRTAGLAAWTDEACTLWPAFAPFAQQISDPDQMTMARYSHGTLRKPWSPGLAHIGDAAHRASPQLGQGANMALLDALALARALRHADGDAALALYARARRWHVRVYQMMSAAFTPQYQSDSRWLPAFRDNILFPLSMIPPVPHILTALVCGTMLPPTGRLRDQRQ
ncbi:FAD-dependent oxidoreductase [Loktanella agnita]|uniref:FAD-dependent oxidoreductase n=1 Tax=Loktanella agnita TaxID=287097 RepID=UPI00398581E5